MPSPNDWRDQAACVDHTPLFFKAIEQDQPRMHYPTPELDSTPVEFKAEWVCAWCPSRHDCITHATTEHEPHGVWGGLNSRKRRLRTEGTNP
jgi:hypothetical protein